MREALAAEREAIEEERKAMLAEIDAAWSASVSFAVEAERTALDL